MSFIKQFFTAESPAANYTGQGISIAFLDTGISPVEDFILPKNRIVAFRDLVNGKREPYDDNGHGTHVTGANFKKIHPNQLHKCETSNTAYEKNLPQPKP